ncbi:hypothetical protein SAMN06297387_1254 [Streptomyces zhaozhouensis]|uniref:Uncharacterized protein n=1 Tax=Streptomyces zhaozhouensis TaxID=1300267 RepID=A0A286E5T0_9ACTN|nr:hypothetical protein SAMN06297387_1254 [Streptomyces zhaozhouensis]
MKRTLLDEWAYNRPYTTNAERTAALTDTSTPTTTIAATPHSEANPRSPA